MMNAARKHFFYQHDELNGTLPAHASYIRPEVPPTLLSSLHLPQDLKNLLIQDLNRLAQEIRTVLCELSEQRSVHFASNLGVVELAIALHSTFDFSNDRLVWDTGHQCYAHKLLTGRFPQFKTIRTQGGLMGYPNPAESDYDLFMTGHAGCSIGTALGLACADTLLHSDENRHVVAVIGDGALGSGPVFEALNHAGGMNKKMIVILNDNKMSICKRVGGLGRYLDHLRMAPTYLGCKNLLHYGVEHLPIFSGPLEQFMSRFKDAVKAGLIGGMFFEDFGFRYIGPVDGHNIRELKKYLETIKAYREPVLLHVLTEKGHGYKPAELDPTTFHAPNPNNVLNGDSKLFFDSITAPELKFVSKKMVLDDDMDSTIEHSFTHWARNSIYCLMKQDSRVCVITAAMAQGNMLEPIREAFPDRFFDVGISEEHAVNLAAGLAKGGMRPIVDIYSTFMQRAYDQIFQEISLQNLPVIFMMDRSGVVGADGPTHHGVFDIAGLRPFPNLTILAPGDAGDLKKCLNFAIRQSGPVTIRYPKTIATRIDRPDVPVEMGKAEVIRQGIDGAIVVCGGLLKTAMEVADYFISLPEEERRNFGVINARFVKPLDSDTILEPIRQNRPLFTLEEGVLMGGFGSAILEEANR
ncbi:MAG: 1-deoxy-D-xylulose-5-phosphate synthase, partial [Thermoguttaceae bacterium]|nr:1-deoxy-D-xylulose-5-phosphate synthase [Thermoguttaceae bacterium]